MSFDKTSDLKAGVHFNFYTCTKMSFDKIFDLTAGVHFIFHNNITLQL